MFLMSIMMLLLFGSMRISIRNWDAGEKRVEHVSKAVAVQGFFRRQLLSIKPLEDDLYEDEAKFSFQGDGDTLRFVSTLPASAGRMGLQIFSVSLNKETRDNKTIVVAIEPFYPLVEGSEWRGDEIEILDRVEKLEFSYYGAEREGQDAAWQDEWLDQEELPKLIKIAIELDGGSIWPAIIIHPRISSHTVKRRQTRKRRHTRG